MPQENNTKGGLINAFFMEGASPGVGLDIPQHLHDVGMNTATLQHLDLPPYEAFRLHITCHKRLLMAFDRLIGAPCIPGM